MVSYANVVNFGPLLKGEGWLPEELAKWLKDWNFQSYSLASGKGRRGLRLNQLTMVNDLVNHDYIRKSPLKLKRIACFFFSGELPY